MTSPNRIEKIKSVGARFQLEISGLEEPLTINRELLERHRLKQGIVITAPQLDQLRAEAELAACDQETARLLALREHSVGEIRRKLGRKQFSVDVINKIVNEFIRRQLLDDAHYAQSLVRQIIQRQPAGRSFLVACLRRKLIDRELAERTVDRLLADHDETELAVRALDKRWSRFAQFDIETARRKAYNYLSRRGIGYPAAKAAFEKRLDDMKKGDDN